MLERVQVGSAAKSKLAKPSEPQLCELMDFSLLSYFSFCGWHYLFNDTFVPEPEMRGLLDNALTLLRSTPPSTAPACELQVRLFILVLS